MQNFQQRVAHWIQTAFGREVAMDLKERNHRFLEEALELVQANGCTEHEAKQLVRYVFARPVGEFEQEMGGTMTTLHALGDAYGIGVMHAAEAELARCWENIEKIRAKRASKPEFGPLPGKYPNECAPGPDAWDINNAVREALVGALLSTHPADLQHFPATDGGLHAGAMPLPETVYVDADTALRIDKLTTHIVLQLQAKGLV